MDWSPDRHLQARMVATIVALVVTTLVATLAVGVVVGLLVVAAGSVVLSAGTAVTVQVFLVGGVLGTFALLGYVVHRERFAPDYAVAVTGARRVDREDAPALVDVTRALAQQVDTPVPEVYLAPSEAPFSLVTGYRGRDAPLVVLTGLLDALDDRQVEAVVAHELAHVVNRDAAVMTGVGLLTMAASRVFELLRGPTVGVEHGRVSRASYADAVVIVGLSLAAPAWAVGRLLGASLSRAREFAADRGAVALTGDPAALAGALSTIDDRLAGAATTDLRTPAVASLCVVAPPSGRSGGALEPVLGAARRRLASHPPPTARIERLCALERAQESDTVSERDW